MKVVLARVDNRLIHGQIVVFWAQDCLAQRIALIDEEIANDETTKMIVKMASPKNYKISVIGPEKFAANNAAGKYGDEKVLMIFKDIQGALAALNAGIPFDSLQLGNAPAKEGKSPLCDYIFVTDAEKEMLNTIKGKGVRVYCQNTPKNIKIDV